MCTLTIAISSYNHNEYIKETIDSIFQQEYESFELIVIDDGSTDGSKETLKELESKHGFTYIDSTNNGLPSNLNKMLEMARGQFFLPFGSDDVMFPGRLECQSALMSSDTDIILSGGNIIQIDEHGKILPKQRKRKAQEVSFDELFLGTGPGMPAPTMMFSTEKLRSIGGFNENIKLEDIYIALKCAQTGHKVVLSDDIYAYYRVHGTNTYKNLMFMYESMKQTLSCFSSHPLYKKALAKFVNSYLVKSSSRDKESFKLILKDLPLSEYNIKTLKALFRFIFS